MDASNGNKTGTQRSTKAASLLFMKYLYCKTRHEAGNFLESHGTRETKSYNRERRPTNTQQIYWLGVGGWRARLKISEGKNYEKGDKATRFWIKRLEVGKWLGRQGWKSSEIFQSLLRDQVPLEKGPTSSTWQVCCHLETNGHSLSNSATQPDPAQFPLLYVIKQRKWQILSVKT